MCSVGIGPNKLVAKMAAELQKPDGLTVITIEEVPGKLWPLPVGELFGVGRKTEKKLRGLGIHTIGELAKYPPEILKQKFGVIGHVLHLSANGINCSPVNPHSLDRVKSVGNQLTLSHDYAGDEIKVAILDLSEKVAHRVRQGGYAGKTVTLSLDLFNQKERFRRLNQACDDIRQRFGYNSILRCTSITKEGRLVSSCLTNIHTEKISGRDCRLI